MEKIAILTDSTSDIVDSLKKKEHIYLIPLYVNINDKYLKDGIDISTEEVIIHNKKDPENRAKSSAPSPGDCAKIIEKIKADGYDKIIIINVSSTLSATYSIFKMQVKDDENIRVIDSKSASLMESLMVNYADDLINEGRNFQQICDKLDQIANKKAAYAWVDNLDSLRAGGRLSSSVVKAVKFFNIKPILKVSNEGKLELVKLKAKEENAINQALDKVRSELSGAKEYYFAIAHGGDFDMFKRIEEKAADLISNASAYLNNSFGSVIRVHSGEKAFAIFYIRVN